MIRARAETNFESDYAGFVIVAPAQSIQGLPWRIRGRTVASCEHKPGRFVGEGWVVPSHDGVIVARAQYIPGLQWRPGHI